MEKIDILLYTNSLIDELDNMGFFESEIFISKNSLSPLIIKQSEINFNTVGSHILTMEQLDDIFNDCRMESITDALHSLIRKDIVDVTGVDKGGNFLYGLKKK